MTTPPSCFDCPSLLPARDSTFFRKSIGAPVCARYGKPIGTINSNETERRTIARQFAKNCSSFGNPRPATPTWEEAGFRVMLPDPTIFGVPSVAPDMVNSCGGCKHFVREDAVANELGWTAALCAAKGKLLLAQRYTLEARACDVKDFGAVRTTTEGLTFLPEYEPGFAGSSDATAAYKSAKANFVDPTVYESDKDVSDEDAGHGIRAWRLITDPISGNEIYLPIYDREFFAPEEQQLIPTTGDDEHPEDYVDHNFYVYKVAVLWLELDETPAFWGKAGTGKTEFFRHMAYLMQLPFHRFSITGSTEVDELVGSMQYAEGVGTFFDKGLFVRAWESPCVMVVDEMNLGAPDVQQVLRPCIDNSKQLVLTMAPGAPRIKRSLDTYLGVAMNPAWDMLNVGANTLGDADANRLMHLYVELPSPELEREIITKRCEHDGYEIPKDKLDTIMAIATDIRALTDNQTLPISWAIRPQLKVARAFRWFDALTAYKMAAADYLEPEQQVMLLDVVKSHIGDSL